MEYLPSEKRNAAYHKAREASYSTFCDWWETNEKDLVVLTQPVANEEPELKGVEDFKLEMSNTDESIIALHKRLQLVERLEGRVNALEKWNEENAIMQANRIEQLEGTLGKIGKACEGEDKLPSRVRVLDNIGTDLGEGTIYHVKMMNENCYMLDNWAIKKSNCEIIE